MLILLNQIQQIVLEVLKNKINLAFLLEGLFDAYNVLTFKHFQHLDLSLDGATGELILICFFELFDGD